MKKHEKNVAENGKGKGQKTFGNESQNGMRKLARNCLYPAQHSIQHINKKIIAHPNKGKMPAAKDKKGKCVMRGFL